MKLLEFLTITEKKKFRKPMIMYHGTSSGNLRSILKYGIVPSPSKKVWQDDEFISANDFSRASLDGSYWTSNLMTASSSGHNATDKFKGSALMVIAQIAEQSAHADEDSINFTIQRALPAMYNELAGVGIVADAAIKYSALAYFSGGSSDSRLSSPEQMLNTYATILHNELAKNAERELIDLDLMKRMMEAHMWRQLAYLKQAESDSYYTDAVVKEMDRLAAEGKVPAIPALSDVENTVKELQDALTRKYTKTAYASHGDFAHTLRITEPVTFRGANKILCIMGEMANWEAQGYENEYRAPMVLYYGEPPADFFEQYRSRKGTWLGAVNPQGEMVIPPTEELTTTLSSVQEKL
jgi:hypothetical protein